jgi:hypothetical protein
MGHCSVLQLQQHAMQLLLQLTLIINRMANSINTLALVLLTGWVIGITMRVRRQMGCSSCHLGCCQ